jgi:eukaryotic-like serine/threonine-protein kinase
MQLTAGSSLQGGKYLINHPLETQGFGVTYRGTQTYHGQPVVIKTLHPALHKSRAFNRLRDRFIDIASILTRCQHPSIVRVIELFQEGDLPFVVMEYVPGQKLTDLVQPGQTMAEMEALHYIRLIGAALTIGQRFNLVHGNLKPQNIIRRGGSNVPVLVGYGISAERMLAAVQYAVPGFPHEFNAPEQIGEKGDRLASADVYALAANLYFLLTGHPPMLSTDRAQADLTEQLPLLSLINPTLQEAIVQGLSLNPKARPKTVDEWLNQLPGGNTARVNAARPENLPTIERLQRPVVAAPTVLEPPTTTLQTPPTELREPNEGPIAAVASEAIVEPTVDRPAFRQEPLPAPTPTEPTEKRPRFRQEPVLPNATVVQPVPLVPTAPSRVEQQVEQQMQQRPVRPYASLPKKPTQPVLWKKMLGLTGCIAATIGITFGLALRFSAARAKGGSTIFHAEQTFPDRDWKGTLAPADTGDGPIEDSLANPPVTSDKPTEKDNSDNPKSDAAFSTEPMIETPKPMAPRRSRSVENGLPDRAITPSKSIDSPIEAAPREPSRNPEPAPKAPSPEGGGTTDTDNPAPTVPSEPSLEAPAATPDNPAVKESADGASSEAKR